MPPPTISMDSDRGEQRSGTINSTLGFLLRMLVIHHLNDCVFLIVSWMHFLMTHPERVHSRAQLLDRVWGDHVFIEERTVDVHVKRLREALSVADCAGLVETVRGAGYRLAATSAAVAL